MPNEIKKLADYITDIRIISGVMITVIGVVVWVAISWTSLLERVDAVEENQQQSNISEQLEELKIQQAIISEKVTGIENKSNDTNALVRQLLNIFNPK